jgi:hypothetical protein
LSAMGRTGPVRGRHGSAVTCGAAPVGEAFPVGPIRPAGVMGLSRAARLAPLTRSAAGDARAWALAGGGTRTARAATATAPAVATPPTRRNARRRQPGSRFCPVGPTRHL